MFDHYSNIDRFKSIISHLSPSSLSSSQIFDRLILSSLNIKQRRLISIRDIDRLPSSIDYVSINMMNESSHCDSMTTCEYQFDRYRHIDDECSNRRSYELKTDVKRKIVGHRHVQSMIDARDSFKKIDDRSGQKHLMNQLAVDNLKQVGVEVFCKSKDDLEPDARTDAIVFIAVSITDEHKKVIAENTNDAKLSCTNF